MRTRHFAVSFAAALLAALQIAARATGEETPMPTDPIATKAVKTAIATFGTGCFWCTEAVFEHLAGVRSVTSGYAGGNVANPTYRQVCSGKTGHAEVVRIEYDPDLVAYAQLLDLFWRMHDPTTLNRQGADVGTQYRSVIFYHTDEQKRAAEDSRRALETSGELNDPIVTEIVAAPAFYPAEVDHQDYFKQNRDAPYCRLVIRPKLRKLKLEP
jgi:peptide-methionine (S)-S-oxide reductase